MARLLLFFSLLLSIGAGAAETSRGRELLFGFPSFSPPVDLHGYQWDLNGSLGSNRRALHEALSSHTECPDVCPGRCASLGSDLIDQQAAISHAQAVDAAAHGSMGAVLGCSSHLAVRGKCPLGVPTFVISMDPATARARRADLQRVVSHCGGAEGNLTFVPAVHAEKAEEVFAWSEVTREEWAAMPPHRDDRMPDALSQRELALSLSHLRAARLALAHLHKSGGSHALVLEEDADMSALEFWPHASIREWIQSAGLPQGWLAVLAGASVPLQPSDFDKADTPLTAYTWGGLAQEAISSGRHAARWRPAAGVWGTFAILYSREGLERLVNAFVNDPDLTAAPECPVRFKRTAPKYSKADVADVLVYSTLEESTWIAVPPFVMHSDKLQQVDEDKGNGLRVADEEGRLESSSDQWRLHAKAFALQTMRLGWCNRTDWAASDVASDPMRLIVMGSQVLC